MMQNRRRGRPPLPQAKRRTHRVVTFLTCPEIEKLKSLAEYEQTSVSRICYEFVAHGLDERPTKTGEGAPDTNPLRVRHKRAAAPRPFKNHARPLLFL